MPETEPPLTAEERLLLASVYAYLVQSRNRSSSGQLAVETPCYADLNISSPETLSHKMIPVSRLTRGIETC